MIDRRNERSTVPWEAAGYYLKSISERTGLHTVALASTKGLCVTGVGDRSAAVSRAQHPCAGLQARAGRGAGGPFGRAGTAEAAVVGGHPVLRAGTGGQQGQG